MSTAVGLISLLVLLHLVNTDNSFVFFQNHNELENTKNINSPIFQKNDKIQYPGSDTDGNDIYRNSSPSYTDDSDVYHRESSGSPVNNRRRSRFGHKRQRLCEKKYAEYIARIFAEDEDTTADANDSDFNGRFLAAPGEYPHMTAVGYEMKDNTVDYKCGGSLISESFVVTAAHCTSPPEQIPTTVRIGDLNLLVEERYLEPQIRKIKRIHNHPEYKTTSNYNDIALLELDDEVQFTEFVRPIRLWVKTEIPYTTAYAMGYGSTAFAKARTNRLTDLNMTIVANTECNEILSTMEERESGIIESQICAQDFAMNRDTCQGDSGGPLQLTRHGRRRRNRKHYHLIGITSFGLFCRSEYPSVFTRVSSYLDWIERKVWQN